MSVNDNDGNDNNNDGNGSEDAASAAALALAEANKNKDGQGNDNKDKLSDKEAALLKEVMEKKEALNKARQQATQAETQAKELSDRLAKFDGIDLDQVKQLLQEKQDRETAELEKKGEWERVKSTMAEQHQKELDKVKAESGSKATELADELSKRDRQIHELTIGRSFSESNFIRESLTLTANKARVIYGSHFELKDGKVTAYDKPTGSEDRTPLVDGNGEPLNFEKAIEKLVELDPDRDNLLKSKIRAGAGSENDPNAGRNKDKGTQLRGKDRIQAAIAAGSLPKLPI